MSGDATTLETLMSQGYNAMVLHKGRLEDALAAFSKAAADDPSLIATAEAKASELERVSSRCFVSKTRAEFLRRAINQQG